MRSYNQRLSKVDEEIELYSLEEWNELKNLSIHNSDGAGFWVRGVYWCTADEVFSTEPEDADGVIWFSK